MTKKITDLNREEEQKGASRNGSACTARLDPTEDRDGAGGDEEKGGSYRRRQTESNGWGRENRTGRNMHPQ